MFQGTAAGRFVAYAADSGKKLWSFEAHAGFATQPVTYTVEGRQVVTVIAGYRGLGGPSERSPEWDYYTQKRRVLTFALDGTQQLPANELKPRELVDDTSFIIDQAKAEKGAVTLAAHCHLCHGFDLQSDGTAPDLRKSVVPLQFEAINAVVRKGALQARGMPRFSEFTARQVEELQHYIRDRARAAINKQSQKGDAR